MDLIVRRTDNTIVATVSTVFSCTIKEKLTTEKTLSFQALLDGGLENINDTDGYIVQYGNDFYDVVKVKKELSGGLYKITADCEHVSYRLTSYIKSAFSQTGTPREILNTLVRLTGLTAGDVEPIETVTYTMPEDKTKRAAVLNFCSVFGWEPEFTGYEVHIRNHRGSTEIKELFEKNVVSVSKTVDKTGSQRSYSVSVYKPSNLHLGDEVHMKFDRLDIDENVRVVGITRNPFTSDEVQLEVDDYAPSVERDLVNIEQSMIAKGRNYYGLSITPESGLEITRDDNKAKVVMNADEFAMKADDGQGNLVNRLYFDPATEEYKFVGTVKIDGGEINIGDNFRVDQNGNAYLAGDATIYGGRFYAGQPGDAEGFSQMTSGGFEVYNADYDVKLRFGYTTDDEDYPFIQLGSGSGASADYGLVKKFSDGLWIGNSEPEDESGDFAAKTGYNGIFFRFSDNTAYIVNGKTMKNIYTGAAIAKFG